MKHEQIITDLQDLAQQLGIRVRYEKGDFEGGYCILREERVLLINKRMMPPRKAAVLAMALHEIGLDSVFVKPVLREYIEDEVARMARTAR